MKRIKSKRYYRIEFVLATAMNVGSGKNEVTDKDLARDSRNIPYIPATALAGIYRTLFGKEEADHYFGLPIEDNEHQKNTDSRVIVYDAVLTGEEYHISSRDGVGLDEWKTVKEGAKFNFEILEPGAVFTTYIEQDKYQDDENAGDVIAQAWKTGEIVLGGKNSRGFGRVKDVEVEVLEFSFEDEKEIEQWLDFDIYEKESWEKYAHNYERELCCADITRKSDVLRLHLELKQRGPLVIRKYTTRISQSENQPDYEQLVYLREKEGKRYEIPVIPGTSWAGAFRHQMRKLDKACLGTYFGNKEKQKSWITFSESEINGAKSKVCTRNSIDRFTGGAIENALFTEKIYYDGQTVLDIAVRKEKEIKAFLQCLAAAVVDLHCGFLALGGETSVGRGLFELSFVECQGRVIETIPEQPEQLYQELLTVMLSEEVNRGK
ncbi:MAG: RAMP superfamily CRISPR-associated protein [Lachnospiraceae bacterium]